MDTQAHKSRAAAAGLAWADVLAAYREARGLEAAELERIGDARRNALSAAAGDDHAGRFKGRHRAAFAGGDATYIRGLDVAAADRGMTADELYDVLASAAATMRPADEVMRETIDRLIELAGPADDTADMVPLVQAAAAADITEQWLRKLVKAGRIRGRKAGRNWIVSLADCRFFQRHPTAGRPRAHAHLEPAPF